MKQVEITVRLVEDEKSAFEKLEKLGYRRIRESDVDDIYLSNKCNELNTKNVQEILRKSVLLRSLKFEDEEIKKITYKSKELDENGNVIFEKKISLNCEDINTAKELFSCLDFEELVRVKYHVTVYEKDGIELAFQNVENLGILMEYENPDDFEKQKNNDLIKAKEIMFEQVKNLGLELTNEMDVKKAKELILKRLQEKFQDNI